MFSSFGQRREKIKKFAHQKYIDFHGLQYLIFRSLFQLLKKFFCTFLPLRNVRKGTIEEFPFGQRIEFLNSEKFTYSSRSSSDHDGEHPLQAADILSNYNLTFFFLIAALQEFSLAGLILLRNEEKALNFFFSSSISL